MSTRSSSSATAGTPHYMSPEQLLGRRGVDHRADIWALGVLAFRALTGRRPFHGDTIGALTLAIVGAPPPRPTAFVPSLGSAFDAWFLRACATKPESRFASVTEAARALAGALGVTAEQASRAVLARAGTADSATQADAPTEAPERATLPSSS